MVQVISNSPSQTEEYARKLGAVLKGGETIAYFGGLGMGKTCFTRGLALGLGYNGDVTSPTFALINEYIGGKFPLYHFDMYRISGWEDLYTTGYFEYIEQNGILIIEWSENIASALPQDAVTVTIKTIGENDREITVEGLK